MSAAAILEAALAARQRGDLNAALSHLRNLLQLEPGHWPARLRYADVLRDTGQLDAARHTYSQLLLEQAPARRADAHIGLGLCARKIADHQLALQHFEQACSENPNSPHAALRQAESLRDLSRISEAEHAYRSIPNSAPTVAYEIAVGLGYCARRRSDFSAALAHFRKALELAPSDRNARLRIAETMLGAGLLDESQAQYLDLLSLKSGGDADAQIGLGDIARRRSNNREALVHYRAAIAAAPLNRNAYLKTAQTLRDLAEFEQAERCYREVLAADSAAELDVSLGLGYCAQGRSDFGAALQHFKRTLEIEPNQNQARQRVADCLRQLGQNEAAERLYFELLATDPTAAFSARLGLGHLSRGRLDFVGAEEHFSAAVAINPKSRAARMRYAETVRDSGKLADAINLFEALLAEDSGAAFEANLGLADCARRKSDSESSLSYLRAALESAPTNQHCRMRLAQTLGDLQRWQESDESYSALLAEDSRNYWAVMGLGRNARGQGNRINAEQLFKRATELNPSEKAGWLELSGELRDRGDLAGARKIVENVLEASPARADALVALGHIHRRSGEHRLALASFQAAYDADATRKIILIEVAEELWRVGQFEASEQMLIEVTNLASDPAAVTALLRLTQRARNNNAMPQALAYAIRAAKAAPNNTGILLELALCLSDSGSDDKGLEVLRAAQNLPVGRAIAFAGEAALLRRAGRLLEALEVVARAQSLGISSFGLSMQRFHIEMALGKPHRARVHLDSIHATNVAEQAEIENARGQLAESRFQVAYAIECFSRATLLNPENVSIRNGLARVHLMACDIEAVQADLVVAARLGEANRWQMGLSSNPSQSQVGQLIQEYLLGKEGLEELKRAMQVPANERIRPLLGMVRRMPHYTPVALALLTALRESGRLSVSPRIDLLTAKIPSRIVQFWNDEVIPNELSRYMETWRQKNSGFDYVLFNEKTAAAFISERCSSEVLSAFLNADQAAKQADLFRLAYLAVEGGYYADADDVCRLPLRQWLPSDATFIGWHDDFGAIGNNFLAAVPGHPIVTLALSLCAEALNRHDGELVWLSTGPGLISRAYAQTLAATSSGDSGIEGAAILERHQLFRGIAAHCFARYKKTSRHWLKSSFGARPVSHALRTARPDSEPAQRM